MEQTKVTISKETLSRYIAKIKVKKLAQKERRAIQELIYPEITDEEFEVVASQLEKASAKLNSVFAEESELSEIIAKEASKEAKVLLNQIIGSIIDYSGTVTIETIIKILSLLNIEVVE